MELQHPIEEAQNAELGSQSADQPATHRIELWDWPLRVFHWSLVLAVSIALVTGKVGGDWMAVHGQAGITIVGLLAFRIVWGLLGSTHARFSSFVPTPHAIFRYIKGVWFGVGHNPLGALSVIALLTVLAFQAVSGLVANDDIAYTGPLISLMDEDLSHQLTGWHKLVANGIFILVGLHIVAIAAYRILKKTNLIGPMITGKKAVPQHIEQPEPFKPWGLAVALIAAAVSLWLASGLWIKPDTSPTTPSTVQPSPAPELAASATPGW